MTTDRNFTDRNRDLQDGTEVHTFGKLEYVDDAGAVVRVKGTGTTDDEVIVANSGVGFNLDDDSDAEVVVLADGSDMGRKYGLMQLPHKTQRKWSKGASGIQCPTNGDRAVEINGDETWLKDGTFIVGHDKAVKITVDGANITLETGGTLTLKCNVAIEGDFVTHNGTPIDDTHTHGGVEPGGGSTSVPNG